MKIRPLVLVLALKLLIALGLGSSFAQAADQLESNRLEYNRDIRPVFSDTCFTCHGPDARKREAGLRLDKPEGAVAKLDSGTVAIVPGKSTESELVKRITSTDPDVQMPPPDSNKHITPAQIELLKEWIDEGAVYEGHWSFLPIARPVPSEVLILKSDVRIQSPIDKFVIAELRRQSLPQSPQADSVTLARRVAFDVTGLPPTPEQVAMLVADPSDANYEKLVDQLFASPRYGERMAMWWLDLVRYADSVGYHGDQVVSAHPFREWVIRAFNDNTRFDQFTTEQLAGDLLPNPSIEQKIAAGYNRLGMMTAEGGAQAKEYLAKYASERVRNVGGAWLGLTTGCCECHDHKFDPLTTRDFYQLEAFFADIQERGVYGGDDFDPKFPIPTTQQATELARLDGEIDAIKKQLDTATPELVAAQAEWEKSLGKPVDWIPLKPVSVKSNSGATLAVQDDNSVLASATSAATDTYTVTVAAPPPGITAFRMELLPHDSLPAKGPGWASNGNFVLTELSVKQKAADGVEQPVALANPTASFEQADSDAGNPFGQWPVAAAIDGDAKGAKWGWAISPEFGKPHYAVFETQANTTAGTDGSIVFELLQNHDSQHTIGRFRILATTSERPVRVSPADALPPNIHAIVKVDSTQRNDAQKNELAAYYRSIAPALQPARDKLAATQKQRNDLNNSLPTMLATIAVAPRMIRVLPRGNWMDDSGEEVKPAVPAFLPQPPAKEARLTRLDLARWIVSKENPLPARTFVNRLWKLCFGAGLSRKLDDLGAQGDWPSHPKLLDWLAADFMDNGWDVKRTMKQIVMSATYRQASLVSPELREKDAYNRWLARQGRSRLDAEVVRDNALWISGLLVERIGGPSVTPYQPPRYWAYLNFPEREWQNATGDDLYRRGLYTHWQRQYLHPSLLAFDAPSREECTADRVRSNTPLQSLVLLNDPTYVEAARVFAEIILHQGGSSPNERLDYAFRRALSRPVKPAEAELLTQLLTKHVDQFKKDANAANELLSVGARPRASDLDPVELAAWTSVARSILNLHAVITRN